MISSATRLNRMPEMQIRSQLRKFFKVSVIISFNLWIGTAAAEPDSFEAASDLRARDVLPAELIKGEHHKVDKVVKNDGYLNYYRI